MWLRWLTSCRRHCFVSPIKAILLALICYCYRGWFALLKNSAALVEHALKVIEGYGPASVLNTLLVGPGVIHEPDGTAGQMGGTMDGKMDDEPILPDIPIVDSTLPYLSIPGLSLW